MTGNEVNKTPHTGKNSYRKRYDILLIGGLLLLSGILWLVFSAQKTASAGEGPYAVVYVDGKETARYSLLTDGEYELNSGTNTLRVEAGKAWMSHAECPDQVCISMGVIEHNNDMIVCLPNKLYVIVEGGEDGELDAISR